MTLQSNLNNAALNYLPKILKIIKEIDHFEANQIKCYTLRDIGNRSKAIYDMNLRQIEKYENCLLEVFKHKNWIN